MKRRLRTLADRFRWAFLAAALIAAGSEAAWNLKTHAKDKPAPLHLNVTEAPVTRNAKLTTSFAPIVKKVAPSVVKVYTTSKPKMARMQNPALSDPFFRRFFGGGDEEGQMGSLPKQHGLGSGVIVTSDGYILTNNHVVENADEVKVALANDSAEYTAKVVGTDPKTDVAVLKIDAKNLPFMELADSDKIEVGDIALAIGNPFGIGQTTTMGMISAKGRSHVGTEYEDFIQTDAAINPGNSGGALVDTDGRLIGINTAILSRSGGNQGIGFAVPINLARYVMENIVQNGRVVRGFLGVNIQDVTPALAKEFGLKDSHGALVAEVTPKSPADRAGLKAGDVIAKFNGKSVEDARQLKLQVATVAPNTKASVEIWRDGKSKSLEVTTAEYPNKDLASKGEATFEKQDALDGVEVSDLNSRAVRDLNLPSELTGALVSKVDENCKAFEAGLREGDVILEINKHAVKNADQAVELSSKNKQGTVLLRVWSKGFSHYLVIDQEKVS